MTALTLYHLVALFLLAIGLFGVITRRTLIGILISVELLLNGAGLSLAASSKLPFNGDEVLGQLGTIFIMGLAAAEATLVLAMIVVVSKRIGSVKLSDLTLLKGSKS